MLTLDGVQFDQPLFISSRLMAALKINGVGVLHLHAEGRDGDHRMVYKYVIEDADGNELETGNDLSSGVNDPIDYLEMMASLIGFLYAAAERANYVERSGHSDGDPDSFNAATTAWAQQNSDELSIMECVLEEESERSRSTLRKNPTSFDSAADTTKNEEGIIEIEPEMVPKASTYGCGADECQDCYPVIYRCEHGVDYPKPRINNAAARAAQLEDCEHHDEMEEETE